MWSATLRGCEIWERKKEETQTDGFRNVDMAKIGNNKLERETTKEEVLQSIGERRLEKTIANRKVNRIGTCCERCRLAKINSGKNREKENTKKSGVMY